MSTAALLESEPRVHGPRLVADPRQGVPVGLELRIETPENVVLAHQLAGPAPRAAAYAIDFAFRLVIFAVFWAFLRIAFSWSPGLGSGLLLFGLFLMEWGYFVLCEGFFNGRTIGKTLMSLRVIQEKGYAVTMWSVVLRNLLRAADYLLFFAPAFLSMLFTRRFQRLGDLVAHTVVVSERVIDLPKEPVIVERIAPLKSDEIGSWVPPRETLALIDEFLGRRAPSRIPPERGHTIVSRLARALARRLDYRGDRERLEKYPMAFIAQVYVTFARKGDEENGAAKSKREGSEDAADLFDLDDDSDDLEAIVARDIERDRRRRTGKPRRRTSLRETDDEEEDEPRGDPNDLDEIVARDTERERRRRRPRTSFLDPEEDDA